MYPRCPLHARRPPRATAHPGGTDAVQYTDIIVTQSPQSTGGFTLGIVSSAGLDKCVHDDCIPQGSFAALRALRVPPSRWFLAIWATVPAENRAKAVHAVEMAQK